MILIKQILLGMALCAALGYLAVCALLALWLLILCLIGHDK